MAYWRMQLHPADSANAVKHTVRCLGLGYIGLDFAKQTGDLTTLTPGDLEATERDYWDFANTMGLDDLVLVVAHHYPCALVKVTGEYNYIRRPREELGIWFQHFRKIETLGYYADLVTNPASWERTTMTDTISKLKDEAGISYRLIQRWIGD